MRRALPSLRGSRLDRACAFLELFAALEEVRYTHIPFSALGSYIRLLPRLDLDIGLCPLEDTPFNRHKSALKFYEYAACGTMTIASDVEPYRQEVSVVVPGSGDAWCDALEKFLADPESRDRELERQREFVLTERNIESLKSRWAETLDALIERSAPDAR